MKNLHFVAAMAVASRCMAALRKSGHGRGAEASECGMHLGASAMASPEGGTLLDGVTDNIGELASRHLANNRACGRKRHRSLAVAR